MVQAIKPDYSGRVFTLSSERASRHRVEEKAELSDWKLDPAVFNKIRIISEPFNLDLFAVTHITQLVNHITWHPDLAAQGTDAL